MNSKTVVKFIQSAQKGCLVRLKFEKKYEFFCFVLLGRDANTGNGLIVGTAGINELTVGCDYK